MVIGAFVGTLLLSIVASVELSTLSLNFSTVCFGSPNVWLGHSAGFRVAALDAQSTRFLPSIDVTAELLDGQSVVAQSTVQGVTLADLNLTIPLKVQNETLSLRVRVESDLGSDNFTLALRPMKHPSPINSVFSTSQQPPYSLKASSLQKNQPTTPDLELFPMAGHLISGLPNLIFGRITDGTKPPPKELALKEGNSTLHPNAAGLFSFTHIPRGKDETFTFLLPGHPHPGLKAALALRPAQLLLTPLPKAVFRPGEEVLVEIQTLPFRSPIHVDLWAGSALLKTTSTFAENGHVTLPLSTPVDFTGLIRIDAYKNFIAPQDTATSTHAFVTASSDPYPQLFATLSGRTPPKLVTEFGDATSGPVQTTLARLALARLFPPHEGAPLLRNTYDDRHNQITHSRDQLRTHVHQIFLASVAVGLLSLLGWVVSHQRKRKSAVSAVIHEGISQGEEWDPEAIKNLTRTANRFDITLTFLAIALIFYAVYVLLTRLLQWGF